MQPDPGRHTRASAWTVIALMVAHALLTVLLARARYLTVHHHTYDLALYGRLAWGLAHGQAWDPILGTGAFGGHLSLVLAPLGALGALFGTVPVLLVAQSAAFAAAAWPLSQLAVRRAGPLAGVLVALGWLLQPNLGHVASYEFHPGSLAVLPLCWAFELADREPGAGTQRLLLVACALTVACRASLALQTLMLGLVLLRARGGAWRRTGALVALGSAAWFGLWLLLAGVDRSAGGVAGSLDQHYGLWGGSPLGALGALFTDPGALLAHLGAPERLLYPLRVLLPFALLPLLAPAALLVALPPLALNLLSAFPTACRLDSHYLTTALPPLAWGAVIGGQRLAARLRAPRIVPIARLLAPALLAAAAATANVLLGGLPWSHDFVARDFRPDRVTTARWRALSAIPAAASVQAPDALLPHLIERTAVFRAPPPARKAELVVLDVTHRRTFAQHEDLLRTVQEPGVRRWLARSDHQLVLAAGDLLVLRRGRSPRGGLARKYLLGPAPPGRDKRLAACLSVRSVELQPRAAILELVAQGPCPDDLALRLGAGPKPRRVDLLFDGLLSPAHLRKGDLARSRHRLSPEERIAIDLHGLHVGALRSSGARPEPVDPISVLAPPKRR